MEQKPQTQTNNATCQRLARQLRWLRVLQMLLELAIFFLAGYLIVYIGARIVGHTPALHVVMTFAGISFAATLIMSWCMWHFGGYHTRGWVVTSIILDCFFNALQNVNLTILGASGLPWNCNRLIKNGSGGDSESNVGFGNGTAGSSGTLDHYCSIPKACFWQSAILSLLYFLTTGLSIRLVVVLTRKRKADKELASKYVELEENSRQATGPMDVTTPGPPQDMPNVLSQATEEPSPLPTTDGLPQPEIGRDLEAMILNGSWNSGSERGENVLPPYHPPAPIQSAK